MNTTPTVRKRVLEEIEKDIPVYVEHEGSLYKTGDDDVVYKVTYKAEGTYQSIVKGSWWLFKNEVLSGKAISESQFYEAFNLAIAEISHHQPTESQG
jgi:hypothetical protein